MRNTKYKKIVYLIGLLLVINIFSGYSREDAVFAQEVTESVTEEQKEDEQEGGKKQNEGKQDGEYPDEEEGEQGGEHPDEEPDEKAPEITIFTNPELDSGGDFVPIITEAELDYTVIADEPCNIVMYIEKTTVVMTDGEITVLTEMEEKEIVLTEETLECSVTFEEEGEYVVYVTAKDAAGNEAETEKTYFRMDRTAPAVNIFGVEDGTYYNEKQTVEFMVSDFSLDMEKTVATIWKDEEVLGIQELSWVDVDGYQCKAQLSLEGEGSYKVALESTDRAGNRREGVIVSFWINWTAPVIRAECDMDYTAWSDKDIIFHTTVSDSKVGIKKIIYKANGKTLKKITFDKPVYAYDYDLTISENADKVSGYPVTIEATNNSGLSSTIRRKVYIDKEAPRLTLSGVENGTFYNEEKSIMAAVQDTSYSGTEIIFLIRRTLDGKTETMSVPAFHPEQYEDTYSFKMTQEGAYQIHAIATDGAGNITKSNMLSFVIDRTAPRLKLTGVKMDSMNNAPVELQILCEESFYITNNVSIQITRRLDGKTTTKELTEFPKTGKQSYLRHTFAQDGMYLVTVSATDKAGNASQIHTLAFSVDQTKPKIRIHGTGNYEQWGKPATLQFAVVESFYQDNTVILSGTRRDMYGTVSDIKLPRFKNTGKTSTLSQTFKEDGIYTFHVFSKDKAGNESSRKIHFTIDQTAPQINGIKEYDGGCYKEFKLGDTLDGIFEDLTVISYRILLNGVEYNGTDTITEEGKYSLFVMAEDELGHTSSETIEFIISNTVKERVASEKRVGKPTQKTSAVNSSEKIVYNSDSKDERKIDMKGLLLIPVCLCLLLQIRKRKGKREKNDKSNCI